MQGYFRLIAALELKRKGVVTRTKDAETMCRGPPDQSYAFWSKDASSLQGAAERDWCNDSPSLTLIFPFQPMFPHGEPACRFCCSLCGLSPREGP